MKQSDTDFVHSLRQSSAYIHMHRDKLCVIYLPGELILDPDSLNRLADDLALLHALGLKMVLVLGATAQIDQALEAEQIDWHTHQQFRITSIEMIPTLQKTLGQVRSQLEAAFSRQPPLYTNPISLCSGNWVIAQPKGVIDGVDFQHTGEIRKINQPAIQALLDSNQVVLLTPLAYSLTGEVFNLNTLEQACAVANRLEADKLLIFCHKEQTQGLPSQLSLSALKTYPTQNNDQSQLFYQLIHNANKVKRIHLIQDSDPNHLLVELFSRDGLGTLVFTDRYHQIRPARIEDVSGIINLITPLEQQGKLVKRSRERLELEIDNFTVIERDNLIIGCAALYPLEDRSAELACLAIDPNYQGQRLGEELLHSLEQQAQHKQISQLFLLTTHTQHWFIEHGFRPSERDALPNGRQALYNEQRKSKVLIKPLTH